MSHTIDDRLLPCGLSWQNYRRQSVRGGIVTRARGGVTCRMAWHRESGPVLSLSQASFESSDQWPLSEIACRHLHAELLSESRRVAKRHGNMSRTVLMTSDPDAASQQETLIACGFAVGTQIVEFQRNADHPVMSPEKSRSHHDWRLDISCFEQIDAFEGDLVQSLQLMLDAMPLVASLPRPHAAELIVEWTDTELVYVVLRRGGQCIGLAVGMPIDAYPRRIRSVFGSSIERPHMDIRFVGVLPDFRRQGVARHLLDAISSLALRADAVIRCPPTAMSAWCDTANHAAVGLYHGCGFTQVATAELWVG